MQQQVLISLNQFDPTKPLLRKPQQQPELPPLMQIGPHLPHDLIDLEPLPPCQEPRQRQRRRQNWMLAEPSKASSHKAPLKPLSLVVPPLPPQPQAIQNRPNIKGRNTKKATFKVSFIEPQIAQPQEQQRQKQRTLDRQEDSHQAADIRWNTVNQPTRKWVRKKHSTTTSCEAVGDGRSSTGSLINGDIRKRPMEPPENHPLEPLKHQVSIQTIAKKAGRRQRQEVAAQRGDLIEPVEEPGQGRNLRSRKGRNLEIV